VSLLRTAGWTFAFCGRLGTECEDLLNRVFRTHLVGFLLYATKQEWKSALKRLRYCVSQDAQGSAFCKWAELHCTTWRRSSTLWWYFRVTEVGTKGLIHGLVEQTQFCVSFISPWWQNASFKRLQSFQFLHRSLFRSSPVVMNLRWRMKKYCQKNTRQRWDLRRVLGVALFDKEHWSEIRKARDVKSLLRIERSQLLYVSLAVCPECPRKEWRDKSFAYSLHPQESGQEVVQGPGGVTKSPILLGPV